MVQHGVQLVQRVVQQRRAAAACVLDPLGAAAHAHAGQLQQRLHHAQLAWGGEGGGGGSEGAATAHNWPGLDVNVGVY